MPNSQQGSTTRVTGSTSKLIALDVASTAGYTYYNLGGVPGTSGGEATFFIHVYNNDQELTYIIQEGVDIDGPWDDLSTGVGAIGTADPSAPSIAASGVFYGGVVRIGIKHSTTPGTFSIKMLAK